MRDRRSCTRYVLQVFWRQTIDEPGFAVRQVQIRMESEQLARSLGHTTGPRVCVPVECKIRMAGSSSHER